MTLPAGNYVTQLSKGFVCVYKQATGSWQVGSSVGRHGRREAQTRGLKRAMPRGQ